MSEPSPTPWRAEGGGIGLNRRLYGENTEPTKPSAESLRRGEARRRLELMREAQQLGETLLDPWDDD